MVDCHRQPVVGVDESRRPQDGFAGDAQSLGSGDEFVQDDTCLSASQRGTHAEMFSDTEPEMTGRIRAVHVERLSGRTPVVDVAIGGGVREQ